MYQARILFLLVAAVLLQSFGKAMILFEFTLHADYIAKVLCINRFVPESSCNGQCILMQRMEAEKQKDKSGQGISEKYEVAELQIVYALNPLVPIQHYVFAAFSPADYTFKMLSNLWRPPQQDALV
jgi:hypothetical protein